MRSARAAWAAFRLVKNAAPPGRAGRGAGGPGPRAPGRPSPARRRWPPRTGRHRRAGAGGRRGGQLVQGIQPGVLGPAEPAGVAGRRSLVLLSAGRHKSPLPDQPRDGYAGELLGPLLDVDMPAAATGPGDAEVCPNHGRQLARAGHWSRDADLLDRPDLAAGAAAGAAVPAPPAVQLGRWGLAAGVEPGDQLGAARVGVPLGPRPGRAPVVSTTSGRRRPGSRRASSGRPTRRRGQAGAVARPAPRPASRRERVGPP
jgi:hypothetical protein